MKAVASPCYATLTTLRKFKNTLTFNLRKNIVQSLVLSKLYYNDIAYHRLSENFEKRLQRVQKATVSFVLGRYATTSDLLELKWLPILRTERMGSLEISP